MNNTNLSFGKLFNLSFGFFGVQIAYALQSANISRIFATLGADPHQLSFFWVLPPLMGMIVQPIVGILSDKTWMGEFFGRRKFYLLVGAIIAVAVMVLLPNAGDFTFTQSVFLGLNAAMWFGLFSLMFLDTSINIAMQPFKMMVGDMVNEEQKGLAYSIQSFLCNAGSLAGYIFPILFTWLGIANIAPEGTIPDSVKWSFYIGAAILLLCVLYTFLAVKEMNPEEYAKFHGLNKEKEDNQAQATKSSGHILGSFLSVGLVQFFCWAAFLFMWTYSNGAIASQCFGWDGANAADNAFQNAGNWVGVCFAVQAVGSMLWAMLIPVLEKYITIKGAYAVSLLVGAAGFVSCMFVQDQYLLLGSYALIGAAWAAMLAIPFTIITNAISGSKYMGTLLGLFNCTICLPQIAAALLGGVLLEQIGGSQSGMMVAAGALLVLGAASVFLIKNKH
ncbi:MAG: MFS transporter [Paludibacteraceae bacterium]|nr:MFS transporter [Paludibacteraceae bacterium]